MAKKYVWLKLKDDFFQQRVIKKLRKIAGGDTYTIIYLKLQLLSLKDEGKLFYEGVEDDFAEEMALTIDEEIENVKVTLMFLEKNGLIETVSEDEYLLPHVIDSIGSESASAERVRKHREKQKALHCNTDVTPLLQDETNCNTEKEKDKEIDDIYIPDKDIYREQDIELNEKSVILAENIKKLIDIVVKATGLDKNSVSQTIKPYNFHDFDFNKFFLKISESQFLQGKCRDKPDINHFTSMKKINLIMADGYKDKPKQTNDIQMPILRKL